MSINAIGNAPFFTWNGVNSREMNIVLTEYPPYTRPKERVTNQTIPGRQGQLVLREAEFPVFDPVLRTLQCYTRPGADIGAICAWLCGVGELTLGNDPGKVYDAAIINQIDFRQILRGNPGYNEFAVPFQCQPLKRAATENVITQNASSNTASVYVTNAGHVAVPAIVTVYGSGNITVSVGGEMAAITGANSTDKSRGIVLDWDTGIMTHGTGDGAVLNTKVSGGPQYIQPASKAGAVLITATGTSVSKIKVRENWRWL